MKHFVVVAACLAFSFSSAVLAEEICQTAECKALSEDLLHHSMNESVAPCDDFYDYVCGKWAASHPQKPNSTRAINYFGLRQELVLEEIDEAFLNALNASNDVIRSVATIYTDCLDSATIEKRGVTPLVETVLTILGDWPILQKPAHNATKTPHWQDLYVNTYAHTGIGAAFDLGSYHNFTLRKYIANIQSGTISNDPTGIFITEKTHTEKYRAFLHKLLTTYFAVPDNDRLKADIEAVLHLEQKLHTAYQETFKAHVGFGNFVGSYADLKVALKGKADWQSMVNQVLGKLSLTKVPLVTPTDHVYVHMLPYLIEAVTALETTPISVVQNWLGLLIAGQVRQLMPNELQREIANFTGHHWDPAQRKAMCKLLPKQWPAVDSRIYIDTHFSAREKAEAELLVKSLRIAFDKDLANHTEWLDAPTRKAALEKLEAIKQTVGYEDWIVSDEALTTDYPHLNNQSIVRGKFFESALLIPVDSRRASLSLLHQENVTLPNPRSIVHDPTIVNAFYNRITNSITIPAGILQSPFFDDQRPYSMNYGAIGIVIGHELTHAFDNNGARYDKDGHLRNWWSLETHAKFNEKSKCFADQYSALLEPVSGKKVDGNRTLGENIADNGGIRKAWEAYREHQKATGKPSPVLPNLALTADQLFFAAHAHVWCENVTPAEAKASIGFSVHSPGRFRVNTVLGNTPAFAEAFKCPLGSKMNPAKKCSLW